MSDTEPETTKSSPAPTKPEETATKQEEQLDETPDDDANQDLPTIAPVLSDPVVIENDDSQQKDYMERENIYISEFSQEYGRVEQWHLTFIAYLCARRDPILLQLKETHVKLSDGQSALKEAINLLSLLITQYTAQYDICIKKTQLYNHSLHTAPNHNPIITETGQTDASILALAAITQFVYDSNIDYQTIITTFKQHKQELTTQLKEYNFKSLFSEIRATEAAQDYVQACLQQYYNTMNEFGTQRSDIYALTSSKRKDIYAIRGKYVKSVIRLWNKHTSLCDLVYSTTNDYLKEDRIRAQSMYLTLSTVSQELLGLNSGLDEKLKLCIARQGHAPVQAKEAFAELTKKNKNLPSHGGEGNLSQQHHIDLHSTSANQKNSEVLYIIPVNPTLPTPSPTMVTAKSTAKYFATIPEDATLEELETRAKSSMKPGPFPEDATIVKSVFGKKIGTFSDKDSTLLYTKTHQLHLILQKVIPEKPSTEGQVPSAENHINFHGDSEWVLDGSFTTARKSTKNDHILIVLQDMGTFFSINSEKKILLASPSEVNEWVEFINSHNKWFAHIE